MEEKEKPDWTKALATIVFCVLTVVLATELLTSCSEEGDQPMVVNKVLLVYLAGDNNLSGESYDKFEAIAQGYTITADSRILIYHDTADAAPRLFEIGGQTIEQYEAENSADASVFARVIAKSRSLYPQANFNLLVFSHASGWLPGNSLTAPRSVIADGTHRMELADFAKAIPDRAFGYIVFETCFMAGIEVAYQLKDKADYIVASSAEIVSPGFTDVYRQHMNELLWQDPKIFIQQAFDYFDNQSGYMRSAAFSVTDTRKLDSLAAYIREYCDFSKEIPIDDIQHFDRYSYRLFFDFADYYSRLLETDTQKQLLQKLIDDVVVWKASTPDFMQGYNGFAIGKHSGMTTYIMQERYPVLNENYKALDWYKVIWTE